MSDERTEQATPRKRQKAHEKGDRARSRDFTAGCGTLAGVLALGVVARNWTSTWSAGYQQFLAIGTSQDWDADHTQLAISSLRRVTISALTPLLLIFFAVTAAALTAAIVQGSGVQFHFEALQPKFERLNPVSNLKTVFSLRAVSRLAKSLLPALVLTAVAASKLREQFTMPVMGLIRLPSMFSMAYDLLMDAAWILFLWAAVDYAIEWRSWEKRIRMSKQDMRDESKESEGNPQIKGRIRGLQRQMRRRKMKADISHASVVITNPTHFAVALSFDFDTMDAPKVVAKGRNLLAEQIKSDARWCGIPIVENPPLARSLYRSVEPGQSIPFELYSAVAAILAYLYRRQVEERMREQRAAERARDEQQRKQKAHSAPPRPVPGSAPTTPRTT